MSTDAAHIDLTQLDVRSISCREKHALIFQRWAMLAAGESFVLINSHNPVPLYHQFVAQFPQEFHWECQTVGPDEFHVKITRVAAS